MTRILKMRLVCIGLALSLTLLGLALPASTRAENVLNMSFPTNIFVFVPCADGGAGEYVDLSGDIHLLFDLTISNSGNTHVKSHTNPQGVSGVALTTGDKYQGTGVTQSEFNAAVGMETTFIDNFRIIGQGPGNNFSVHETFHVTINANGDVTVFFDNISVDCN